MTVVVGVDTSETAGRAAKTAARLAAGLGTDLVVVCAASSTNRTGPSVPDRRMTTPEKALEVAKEAAETLGKDHPDLTIEADAKEGKPADVLIEAAQAYAAEVIVVGNRNAQGVTRVLGSVAKDVVGKAPCDVYVAYTK
ncbi:hypothetical protein GCM10011519_00490 [Marmoricola endophyticus]|uniref:UspA domain-containing protein n=1 Tax=Marmoricola endophyticus TaxID=2040280 RepID=A0A917B860_9ACTN|nr:universal stress protein [Marmoricola endophyticus]GGF30963.1 hypothetical protein GCM10011519_00490 [Marmoricola endophyticus]